MYQNNNTSYKEKKENFLPKTEKEFSDFEKEIMEDLSDSAILLRCRKEKIKREISKTGKRIPLCSRSPRQYPAKVYKSPFVDDGKYRQKENLSKNEKWVFNTKNEKSEKKIFLGGYEKKSENYGKAKNNFYDYQRKSYEKNEKSPISTRNFLESKSPKPSQIQKSPYKSPLTSTTDYPKLNPEEKNLKHRSILIIEGYLFIQSKPTFFDKKALSSHKNDFFSKSRNIPKKEISVSNLGFMKNISKSSNDNHFLAFKFNGKIFHDSLENAQKFEKFPSVVINSENFILQNLKEKIFSLENLKNKKNLEIFMYEIPDYMFENDRKIIGFIDPGSTKFKKIEKFSKKKTNIFNQEHEKIGKSYKYLTGFVNTKIGNFEKNFENFVEEKNFKKIVFSLGIGDKKNLRILAHKKLILGYVAEETKFFIPKLDPFDGYLTWDLYFCENYQKKIFEKKNFIEEKNEIFGKKNYGAEKKKFIKEMNFEKSEDKFRKYERNYEKNFEKKFSQEKESLLLDRDKSILSHINLRKYSNSREKKNLSNYVEKSSSNFTGITRKTSDYSENQEKKNFEKKDFSRNSSFSRSKSRSRSISRSRKGYGIENSPKFTKKILEKNQKIYEKSDSKKSEKYFEKLKNGKFSEKKFSERKIDKFDLKINPRRLSDKPIHYESRLRKNNSLDPNSNYKIYNLKFSKSSRNFPYKKSEENFKKFEKSENLIFSKNLTKNFEKLSVGKKINSSRRVSERSLNRDQSDRKIQYIKSSISEIPNENIKARQILDRFLINQPKRQQNFQNQPLQNFQNIPKKIENFEKNQNIQNLQNFSQKIENFQKIQNFEKSPKNHNSKEKTVISSRRLTEAPTPEIKNLFKPDIALNNLENSEMQKSHFTTTNEIKFENYKYFSKETENYTFDKKVNYDEFSPSTLGLMNQELSQMSVGTLSRGFETRDVELTDGDSVDSKSYQPFPLPRLIQTSRDYMNFIEDCNIENIENFQKNHNFQKNEGVENLVNTPKFEENLHLVKNENFQKFENSEQEKIFYENLEKREDYSILRKFIKEPMDPNPNIKSSQDSQIISLDTEHYLLINSILKKNNTTVSNSPSIPSINQTPVQNSVENFKENFQKNVIQPCKVSSTVYPTSNFTSLCTCSLAYGFSTNQQNFNNCHHENQDICNNNVKNEKNCDITENEKIEKNCEKCENCETEKNVKKKKKSKSRSKSKKKVKKEKNRSKSKKKKKEKVKKVEIEENTEEKPKKLKKKKSLKERYHEELNRLKLQRLRKSGNNPFETPQNSQNQVQNSKVPPNSLNVNQQIKLINIEETKKTEKNHYISKKSKNSSASKNLKIPSLIDKLSPIEPIEEFSDGESIVSFKIPENPEDCLRLKSVDKYTIIKTSSKKKEDIEPEFQQHKSKCSSSKDTRESKNGITDFESLENSNQNSQENFSENYSKNEIFENFQKNQNYGKNEFFEKKLENGENWKKSYEGDFDESDDFKRSKKLRSGSKRMRRYSTVEGMRHSIIEEEFRDDSKLDRIPEFA